MEEFNVVIRPYSKSFYGRYFPEYEGKVAEVRIYPYKYKKDEGYVFLFNGALSYNT